MTSLQQQVATLLTQMKDERQRYELTPEEINTAIEIAGGTIAEILHVAPEPSQQYFIEKLTERLSFLHDAIYYDNNRQHRRSERFESAQALHWNKIRNGQSVHLELGTYSVWPISRVEHEINSGLGDLIRLDISPEFSPDIVANAAALPFSDESVDVVASNSLFEHVAYPHDIIRESWRVLRPGGLFRVVVPFNCAEHGCPYDYLRYTGQFFETVLTDAGFTDVVIDTISPSGMYYTLHEMLKSIPAGRNESVGSAVVISHIAMLTVFAALQIFDDHFFDLGKTLHHSTLALAVKPGEYTIPHAAPERGKPFVDRYLDRLICPETGLPVFQNGNELVSLDHSRTYPVINGIPHLFADFGFGSRFRERASSQEQVAQWQLKTENETLRAELNRIMVERDALAAASTKWFEAVIAVTADDNLLARTSRGLHSRRWNFSRRLNGNRRRPSPIALANRARDTRKWELAVRYYRDALDLRPDDPGVWVQCGHALKEAGKVSEAEVAYRKALELDAKNADTNAALGHALALQGRSVEAAAAYRRALALAPAPPLRRALLDELGG